MWITTPPQGWECPKCKRVYSPMTVMCFYCPGETVTTTNIGTTPNKCATCGLPAHFSGYPSCPVGSHFNNY